MNNILYMILSAIMSAKGTLTFRYFNGQYYFLWKFTQITLFGHFVSYNPFRDKIVLIFQLFWYMEIIGHQMWYITCYLTITLIWLSNVAFDCIVHLGQDLTCNYTKILQLFGNLSINVIKISQFVLQRCQVIQFFVFFHRLQ